MKSAAAGEAAALGMLVRQTVNGRIPAAEDIASIPLEARADYSRAVEKEESIDGENLSALTRIRDVYVTRLTGAPAETDDGELRKRLISPVPANARSFVIRLNMARIQGTVTNGGFDELNVALEVASEP